MARRKNGNGTATPTTPLETLITRSVEEAMATWLSLKAITVTDDVLRDAFTDESFRQDFTAIARRVARETLERLGSRRRAG